MPIFNFELFVDVEADDFESALSWLKAMPLEKQLDFHVKKSRAFAQRAIYVFIIIAINFANLRKTCGKKYLYD